MSVVPILKLEGRSGCLLEVLNREGEFFVRKYSKDEHYSPRLVKQAIKQQHFRHELAAIKTPEIIHIQAGRNGQLAWFDMAYVHGEKYSDFLNHLDIGNLRKLVELFSQYFSIQFKNSREVPVPGALFLDKASELDRVLAGKKEVDSKLVERALVYLRQLPAETFLEGPCHGDFTFSNMLFREEGVYLLDFLDSFVESPLIDLVKFRQDTRYYWSPLVDVKLPDYHASKVRQIFDYFDQAIEQRFFQHTQVAAWYTYLQVLNLMRILPYVSKPQEIDFVQKAIRTLI